MGRKNTDSSGKRRKKIKRIRGCWIRVWNNHTKFTDKEIWEVVRHVIGNYRFNVHYAIEVRVQVAEPGCGAYGNVRMYSMDDPIITAWITDNDQTFPELCGYTKGKGYLDKLLLDKTEALMMVLAHEFRHLWQTDISDGHNLPELKAKHDKLKFKRRGYVWGARGVLSNRDGDAYAIRKVREYRRTHQQHLLQSIDYSLRVES